MRTLLLVTAAGGLIGAGLLAVVRAAVVPPPPLERLIVQIHQPIELDDLAAGWRGRLARVLAALGVTVGDGGRGSDLAVAGRTTADQAVTKATTALALAVMPVVAVTALRLAGVGVSVAVAVPAAVVMAVVGWVAPDLEVRGQAARRRDEFRAALSAYLDVVAILLAGGSGTETALYAAAEQGAGWPFVELRGALDRCRLSGDAPWRALERLGRRFDVAELSELAATAAVAGEQGAKIRQSLAARASGLRAAQLAEVEAAAGATTEKMTVPLVVLGVAFLAFILFPAVVQVLQLS
jgi:tight adherence protein C